MNRAVNLVGLSLFLLFLLAGCHDDKPQARHDGKFAFVGFPHGTEVPTTVTIDKSSKTGSFSKTIAFPNGEQADAKYVFDYKFIGTENGFDCYQLDWSIDHGNFQSGSADMKFNGKKSDVHTLGNDIKVYIDESND